MPYALFISQPAVLVLHGSMMDDSPMSKPATQAPDAWTGLVQRLRQRDEAAARETVERLHPHISRIVAAHRPPQEESADLIQETFLRLFTKIDQYRALQPFPHWVARITVNVCLTRLRHHRRRPLLLWSDLSPAEQSAFEQTGHSEAADPDSSSAQNLIHRLLDTLQPKDRLLLNWLELEQKTIPEVASLTGWSSTLVRVRAFRARRHLRKAFQSLEDPPTSTTHSPP